MSNYNIQPFILDLSSAGEIRHETPGYIVQLSEGSDLSIELDVAVLGKDKRSSGWFPLKVTGILQVVGEFQEVRIRWAAQPGRTCRVDAINLPERPFEFKYRYGGGEVIEGVNQAVRVINEPTTVLDVQQTDRHVNRAGLTDLTGATYASAANTTTVIATAVTNTNGVIIREAVSNSAGASSEGVLSIGGNLYPLGQGGTGVYSTTRITNLFIPAGVPVSLVSNNAARPVSCFYEVL